MSMMSQPPVPATQPPDIVHALRRQFVIDYRQQDAVQKLREDRPNVRIFSFESPKFKPGCRKFIVDEIRKFYMWYRSCDPRIRHFYEIIREGLPCRLYFDIEYYREFNADVDGEQMLDDFLGLCARCVSNVLGCFLDKKKCFVVLDSSTKSKFSAHVIVHLPDGKLFSSNVALKPLVRRICQQMAIEGIGLIKAEDGTSKFICDLAVYSRNRNFRLFLSSKCGKEAVLRLAHYCTFYEGSKPPSNAQIFLDSMIVPKDYDQFEIVELPDLTLPTELNAKSLACTAKTAHLVSGAFDGNSAVYNLKSGREASPFPELDAHMICLFKKLNEKAEISMWRLIISKITKEWIIQYQLRNCRYCFNKKREHKRQNVYWSVHFDGMYCVQRCFDVTDCYKFVSEGFPIPAKVVATISPRIGPVFKELTEAVIPKEDSYHIEAAYSESFYSSMYDRLFQEILFKESQQQEPVPVSDTQEAMPTSCCSQDSNPIVK